MALFLGSVRIYMYWDWVWRSRGVPRKNRPAGPTGPQVSSDTFIEKFDKCEDRLSSTLWSKWKLKIAIDKKSNTSKKDEDEEEPPICFFSQLSCFAFSLHLCGSLVLRTNFLPVRAWLQSAEGQESNQELPRNVDQRSASEDCRFNAIIMYYMEIQRRALAVWVPVSLPNPNWQGMNELK